MGGMLGDMLGAGLRTAPPEPTVEPPEGSAPMDQARQTHAVAAEIPGGLGCRACAGRGGQ